MNTIIDNDINAICINPGVFGRDFDDYYERCVQEEIAAANKGDDDEEMAAKFGY